MHTTCCGATWKAQKRSRRTCSLRLSRAACAFPLTRLISLLSQATQRMSQNRPRGWKRGDPRSWIEGHGDALMTSSTHCASNWYVRSRPGVMAAFHAAYGTSEDAELVAMYDRMSVNLPTSSGNPEALRVAALQNPFAGKFGVAQQMHTHAGNFYAQKWTGLELASFSLQTLSRMSSARRS